MTISAIEQVEIHRTTRDSHQVFEVRQLSQHDGGVVMVEYHATMKKAIEVACNIALHRFAYEDR